MIRFAALAAMPVAACASGGSDLPVQEPTEVVTMFADALSACSAGLTATGTIDQAAMARAGWHIVKRTTRLELEDRTFAPNAYPALRPGEYEATRWVREGYPSEIELIRADGTPDGLVDYCDMPARTEDAKAADTVVAGMAGRFGRAPDRKGELPRGGDFLTPRFDTPNTGYYWAMDRNDAYLTVSDDGHVRLSVLAMPDRSKIDQYSPDRPENRIPMGD